MKTCVLAAALAMMPLITLAQQARFSSGTLGVRVDVLVTNGNTYVGGLRASDFELRDNGVRRQIESAEASDAPINAVLALDMSASTTGPRLSEFVAASRTLLDGLRPVDRAALHTFNRAVTPRVPLTSNRGAILTAPQRIAPSGDTAVLDAMFTALAATLAEARSVARGHLHRCPRYGQRAPGCAQPLSGGTVCVGCRQPACAPSRGHAGRAHVRSAARRHVGRSGAS
jgi:hypothetical protein